VVPPIGLGVALKKVDCGRGKNWLLQKKISWLLPHKPDVGPITKMVRATLVCFRIARIKAGPFQLPNGQMMLPLFLQNL